MLVLFDEVDGSLPRTMGSSVIDQCEVEFTAREATTMTLRVVCKQAQMAASSHRCQLIRLVSWKQGGLEGLKELGKSVGTGAAPRFTYRNLNSYARVDRRSPSLSMSYHRDTITT